MNTRQEELRASLSGLGFDEVRFVRIAPLEGHFLRQWLAGGLHADMHWMERSADKRLNPDLVLAEARSAVLLGVNYWPGGPSVSSNSKAPQWARYALYQDYHDTIKPALVEAGRILERTWGLSGTGYRYYVDTGPVMERVWAARAGMGFVGKNGMLISRRYGNWLFLASIYTKAEFEPDPPIRAARGREENIGALCGKCTRCSEGCPTRAIVRPGVVDARLCISYQTIENKGVIPRELRSKMGTHVYGCDVCLEVCPWNRFAQTGRSLLLAAREQINALSICDLLRLTPERFAAVFKGTAIKRVKLSGILRNACIVAANTGDQECSEAVVRLVDHELPVVRAHAVWAAFQLLGAAEAWKRLKMLQERESDPLVQAEYRAFKDAQ